jgi:hypothetical protein
LSGDRGTGPFDNSTQRQLEPRRRGARDRRGQASQITEETGDGDRDRDEAG